MEFAGSKRIRPAKTATKTAQMTKAGRKAEELFMAGLRKKRLGQMIHVT
jgi:hypothetical protein